MTIEQNKALVRKLYVIRSTARTKRSSTRSCRLTSRATRRSRAPGGLAGYKQVFDEVIAAFPDYTITIEDEIAEGETVVTRYVARGTHEGSFLGLTPTGRPIELKGIDINRVADGKIVEHSSEASVGVLLRELGFTPPS
jgi:predicted ester cyclase